MSPIHAGVAPAGRIDQTPPNDWYWAYNVNAHHAASLPKRQLPSAFVDAQPASMAWKAAERCEPQLSIYPETAQALEKIVGSLK